MTSAKKMKRGGEVSKWVAALDGVVTVSEGIYEEVTFDLTHM